MGFQPQPLRLQRERSTSRQTDREKPGACADRKSPRLSDGPHSRRTPAASSARSPAAPVRAPLRSWCSPKEPISSSMANNRFALLLGDDLFQRWRASAIASSRANARLAACAARRFLSSRSAALFCLGSESSTSTYSDGSSTICAKITARAAASGRRAHQRCSVLVDVVRFRMDLLLAEQPC